MEYFNIDVLDYINDSNFIVKLNSISKYLDYAINATIKNQNIYNIDGLEEKSAKKILFDYLNGKTECFTRENGVRQNMSKIGYNNVLNALLKNAIIHKVKKVNIDKEIFDEFNNDILATVICENLSNDKYNETVKLLTSNPDNLKTLISMYVEEAYKLNDEKRALMDTLSSKDDLATNSLRTIEKNMNKKKHVL